ncbi:hypothetical protein [Chryseobacterium taeanense]|uniref:hypothetical protein n=1 Tax=Chryseobacterium taeanense TaxID=311334 RepID=UPI0035B49B65
MNDHLIIPENIQEILNSIGNPSVNLAELPMEAHPALPQFNRSIRVLDIDAKSEQQFIYFKYEQVLKNKETGEEVKIPLPAPEWIVYKETASYLLDESNNPIELPLKDTQADQTTDLVRVPSYKYMLWLLKNNKIRFLELLNYYLQLFVEKHKDELDKLS